MNWFETYRKLLVKLMSNRMQNSRSAPITVSEVWIPDNGKSYRILASSLNTF